MKTSRSILVAVALSAGAVVTTQSAIVSPTDPVPNVTKPAPDGGVGYSWTVNMGPDDRADFAGLVGAWSWDEDTFPATTKGWTHTSNWVALKLRQRSSVTIRLSRKRNVPNPDGGVGGNILFPAFTLYRNWDGDGGDVHTYNNRGNVVWAEDIAYLKHVENLNGATSVELALELPAGEYSIALGGNSPSTNREPAQGYGATILTRPVEKPALTINGGPVFRTAEHSHALSGRIKAGERAKSLKVLSRGRTHTIPVRGGAWVFEARHLEPGRNVLWFSVLDLDGKVADRRRIVIHSDSPADKQIDQRSLFGN